MIPSASAAHQPAEHFERGGQLLPRPFQRGGFRLVSGNSAGLINDAYERAGFIDSLTAAWSGFGR